VTFVTLFFALNHFSQPPDDTNWCWKTKNYGLVKRYLQTGITISLFAFLLFPDINVQAQSKDSLKTGFLIDAAEEYWPLNQTREKQDFSDKINHLPVRNGKGFISVGAYFREVYELYKDYLWGIGPQDNNGYFLHRAIIHIDLHYNENFRVFAQVQSSFISGRNGGPRPVQDLNKLAIDQVFGEYSFHSKNRSFYSLRFGKQALNYGVGSLLDIRETNVRRDFIGAKFIVEHENTRVDLFAMELMNENPGYFDDAINQSQKIAGIWVTQIMPRKFFNRLDAFYIYTHRTLLNLAQGLGTDSRHTIGTALNFNGHRWSGYTEADVQLGKFNGYPIFAWKLTQTVAYQLTDVFSKPALSATAALSSGDHNLQDSTLNTFSPLYPKGIYYGFVDNAGSANMFVIHGKLVTEPARGLNFTTDYYIFWRQSIVDGIYGASGSLLLVSGNDQRRIGSMIDAVASFTFNTHVSLRCIVAYYQRGPFLKQDRSTPHDIQYIGITAILRL
jgi:hypothetical protein